MGFPRPEYWSGQTCPPPGDLPDPGIKPGSPVSPALAGRFFTTEPPLISERLLLLLLSHFVADSVRPHRRQPTRLPRPWDSPGKNTGVGCHFLLQCVKVKLLSRVQLLATPWTAAYQAPPSMGFSRQECWSGLPLPSKGQLFSTMDVPRGPPEATGQRAWSERPSL